MADAVETSAEQFARCIQLHHADGRPKIAPVQGYVQGIPWEMHLRAYNAYSARWSPQVALIDLEKRGCRGGFSTGELDDLLPGWREELSEVAALRKRIATLTEAVERAKRHAEHIGLDTGSYYETLLAALAPTEAKNG